MTFSGGKLARAGMIVFLLCGLPVQDIRAQELVASPIPSEKEVVTFIAPHQPHYNLVGDFYAPGDSTRPTLILLHMLGRDRTTWAPLITEARQRGYGILAMDLRGHGASMKTDDGQVIPYSKFDKQGPANEWNSMVDDVSETVKFLEEKKKIAPEKIGLVGASIGANVALNYFVGDSRLWGVLALSPGLNYRDVETLSAMDRVSMRPVLLVATKGDSYSFESCQTLKARAEKANAVEGKKAGVGFLALQGDEHGTNLLSPTVVSRLLSWIEETTRTGESSNSKDKATSPTGAKGN